MSENEYPPLALYDPLQASVLSRLRLLPSTALTLVSMAIGLGLYLYLRTDPVWLALFVLPGGAAVWALAAAATGALVTSVCRQRPGDVRRFIVPRTWTIGVTLLALALLVNAVTVNPVPGDLQARIFAVACTAFVLLFRLIPVQPLSRVARWIALVVILVVGPVTWVGATKLASSLVAESDAAARLLKERLTSRAARLREVRENLGPWTAQMTPPIIDQRLQTVRAAFEGIDAGIPPDREVVRIGQLGEATAQGISEAATELMNAVAALGTVPDDTALPPLESGGLDRLREARRTFFGGMTKLVADGVTSRELERLAPLFLQHADEWRARPAAERGKLHAQAERLRSAWGTFWLGQTLEPTPLTPTALVSMAFSKDPTAAPDRKISDLDRWLSTTLGEAKRLAGERVMCVGRQAPEGERAECSAWFKQRQRYTLSCPMFDANGVTAVSVTLTYESASIREERREPCEIEPGVKVPVRYRSVYSSVGNLPSSAEISVALPVNGDEAESRAVATAFEDAIRTKSGEIHVLAGAPPGSFWYRSASGQVAAVIRQAGDKRAVLRVEPRKSTSEFTKR